MAAVDGVINRFLGDSVNLCRNHFLVNYYGFICADATDRT